MTRQTKIILIVTGGIVSVGIISLGIYLLTGKKKSRDVLPKNDTYSPQPETPKDHLIQPKYNSEQEISNPFSQIKGQTLFPKPTSLGGLGYANIRSSAEVNTRQGWWDISDNRITTVSENNPIGKVLEERIVPFNGYPYRWFKIALEKPYGFWKTYTEGFVRADTVTFTSYLKS